MFFRKFYAHSSIISDFTINFYFGLEFWLKMAKNGRNEMKKERKADFNTIDFNGSRFSSLFMHNICYIFFFKSIRYWKIDGRFYSIIHEKTSLFPRVCWKLSLTQQTTNKQIKLQIMQNETVNLFCSVKIKRNSNQLTDWKCWRKKRCDKWTEHTKKQTMFLISMNKRQLSF